jgi:hypothetical protein
MAFMMKRWSATGLFAAWGVWWAVLLLASAREIVRMLVVISRAPKGHSSARLNFDDGRAHLETLLDGRVVSGHSGSLLALALWIAGPPLILWLVWLAQRPARPPVTEGGRQPLLPSERWTPTAYHEALRRETMRDRDTP